MLLRKSLDYDLANSKITGQTNSINMNKMFPFLNAKFPYHICLHESWDTMNGEKCNHLNTFEEFKMKARTVIDDRFHSSLNNSNNVFCHSNEFVRTLSELS